MPTQQERILAAYIREANRARSTDARARSLRRRGLVPWHVADALVEAAFLRLVTGFERLLEDLFYVSVLDGAESANRPVMRVESQQEVEALVLGGQRKYVDWLPFDREVLPRGEAFMRSSPFSRIASSPATAKQLDQIMQVRHAIAHRSPASLKRLDDRVKHLRAGRRTPAGLLLERSGGATALVVYAAFLSRVASALCAPDFRQSAPFLQVEPHAAGAKVPAGRYRCEGCRHEIARSAVRHELPTCGCSSKSKKLWKRVA